MAEFFDTKALLKQYRPEKPTGAEKRGMIAEDVRGLMSKMAQNIREGIPLPSEMGTPGEWSEEHQDFMMGAAGLGGILKPVAGGQLFAKLVKEMGAEQFKTVSKPWAKVMMELLRTPQKELSRVSKIEPAWAKKFSGPKIRGHYEYPSRTVRLNIQKPTAVSEGKTLTHEITHARQYTPDPVPQDVARADIIKEMGRLVRKSGVEYPRSAIVDPSEIQARKMSEFAKNFPKKQVSSKLYDELYESAFEEALQKGVSESLPEASVDPRVTKALLAEFKRMFQRTPVK